MQAREQQLGQTDSAVSPQATSPQQPQLHDFRSPKRLSKDQHRALSAINHRFAAQLGSRLSAVAKRPVSVCSTGLQEITFEDYEGESATGGCCCLIAAQPLNGRWLQSLSPAAVQPLIECLLGGVPSEAAVLERPLTEIESELALQLAQIFVDTFASSWSSMIDLRMQALKTLRTPHEAMAMSAAESAVVLQFELQVEGITGMFDTCIPLHSISPVLDGLVRNELLNSRFGPIVAGCSEKAASESRLIAHTMTQNPVASIVDSVDTDIVVNLARSTMKASDLLGLQIGDIITTEQAVSAPLEVAVANVGRFAGKPGAFRGCKAVEMCEAIAAPATFPNAKSPSSMLSQELDCVSEQQSVREAGSEAA